MKIGGLGEREGGGKGTEGIQYNKDGGAHWKFWNDLPRGACVPRSSFVDVAWILFPILKLHNN